MIVRKGNVLYEGYLYQYYPNELNGESLEVEVCRGESEDGGRTIAARVELTDAGMKKAKQLQYDVKNNNDTQNGMFWVDARELKLVRGQNP